MPLLSEVRSIMNYRDIVKYDFVTLQEKEELSDKEIAKLRKERTDPRFDVMDNNVCPTPNDPECDCDRCFARGEIILAYGGMVWSIAEKYGRNIVDPEDLMADGIMALQKAVDSFDRTKGITFTTYAYRAVENRIMLSDMLFDQIARIPNHMKRLAQEVSEAKDGSLAYLRRNPTPEEIVLYINGHRARKKLLQKQKGKNKKEPTTAEIADFMVNHMKDKDKVTIEKVLEFENGVQNMTIFSLDSPGFIDDDEDESSQHELHGFIDPRYEQVGVITKEERAQAIIDQLEPDEQKILCHSFGILGYDKLKAKDIAKLLDKPLSVVSISRKKKEILEKVRS